MVDELFRIEGLEVHFPLGGGLFDTLTRRPIGLVRAVDGVDLTLRRGEVLALVGESGSGKTTIGRVIVKLTRQTAGSVSFEGRDVSDLWSVKELRDYRRRVQLIFQDPYETLDPKKSIHEFVAEPLEVNGIGTRSDRRERVIAALEAAGLRPGAEYASRFPHELSGGQRQRVVIAGALVMDPEVIVADEPVSMLDVSIRTELLRLMLDLREERGLTYLFITHDLSLAWVIADRIAVMYLGRIMEIGAAETVIRSPRNPYTEALVSVSPVAGAADAGRADGPDDPQGRDARRRARAGRLPLPSALPEGLRPLSHRVAAAVRPRRRACVGMLAGRARDGRWRACPAGRGRGRTRHLIERFGAYSPTHARSTPPGHGRPPRRSVRRAHGPARTGGRPGGADASHRDGPGVRFGQPAPVVHRLVGGGDDPRLRRAGRLRARPRLRADGLRRVVDPGRRVVDLRDPRWHALVGWPAGRRRGRRLHVPVHPRQHGPRVPGPLGTRRQRRPGTGPDPR